MRCEKQKKKKKGRRNGWIRTRISITHPYIIPFKVLRVSLCVSVCVQFNMLSLLHKTQQQIPRNTSALVLFSFLQPRVSSPLLLLLLPTVLSALISSHPLPSYCHPCLQPSLLLCCLSLFLSLPSHSPKSPHLCVFRPAVQLFFCHLHFFSPSPHSSHCLCTQSSLVCLCSCPIQSFPYPSSLSVNPVFTVSSFHPSFLPLAAYSVLVLYLLYTSPSLASHRAVNTNTNACRNARTVLWDRHMFHWWGRKHENWDHFSSGLISGLKSAVSLSRSLSLTPTRSCTETRARARARHLVPVLPEFLNFGWQFPVRA